MRSSSRWARVMTSRSPWPTFIPLELSGDVGRGCARSAPRNPSELLGSVAEAAVLRRDRGGVIVEDPEAHLVVGVETEVNGLRAGVVVGAADGDLIGRRDLPHDRIEALLAEGPVLLHEARLGSAHGRDIDGDVGAE